MKIIKIIEDYGWGMVHIRLKDDTRILVSEKVLIDNLISESKKLELENPKLP